MLIVALSSQAVALWVASILTFVFGCVVFAAFTKVPAVSPTETAVAYEHAWDRLDFATLWRLSSPLLRDGRNRDEFVRDKREAYRSEGHLSGLVKSVRPTMVDTNGPVARVHTRLGLADGSVVVDEILLERNGASWQVTAYTILSQEEASKIL